MNQEQLFQRIDGSWKELKASYEGLSEVQMQQRGVTGDWSVKDILPIGPTKSFFHLPHR